jgi:hypothetical protein
MYYRFWLLKKLSVLFQNIDVSALTAQIKSIESEMNGLQKQLISALEQLSVCKAQQANDEERISSLTEKCVTLQTR